MKFTKRDLSVGMIEGNLICLPIMLTIFGTLTAIQYLFSGSLDYAVVINRQFLPALLLGIIGHEILHALTWVVLGKVPIKEIRFNIHWLTLSPYAHAKVPMKKWAYVIGSAMPGVVLGILPFLAGLILSDMRLIWFGVLFSGAAVGDILVLWQIRNVSADALIEDHPSRAGCVVSEPLPPLKMA